MAAQHGSTDWRAPATLADAKRAQADMAARVEREDRLPATIRLLGGADASCTRFDPARLVHAAMVTLEAASLAPVCRAAWSGPAPFPYVPGYLGFREAPALLEAFAGLAARPDLLFVDGQGVAHPRGLGIASQLGVLLDLPTIGVAKSLLVGAVERERVVWHGETIAAVVSLRPAARPIYVSVGHRVSLATAVAWVRRCGTGHRLPAPTRLAHLAAGEARRAALSE